MDSEAPRNRKSSRPERVVERRERLFLQARLEIDQEVAAANQVDARERRVGDETLAGEHHHFAERLAYPVAALLLDEKVPQPLWRDVVGEALGVQAVAGLVQ
jgi:hypothetical protein